MESRRLSIRIGRIRKGPADLLHFEAHSFLLMRLIQWLSLSRKVYLCSNPFSWRGTAPGLMTSSCHQGRRRSRLRLRLSFQDSACSGLGKTIEESLEQTRSSARADIIPILSNRSAVSDPFLKIATTKITFQISNSATCAFPCITFVAIERYSLEVVAAWAKPGGSRS